MQIDTRPKTLQSIRRSNFCVFFILPSLLLFMTMLFLFARREFVMLRILLILYAVLLVTAVVVFRRHADQITASISPILETTARYQAGDTRSLCDDTDCTIQEFQMIADNLNNMIHNINRHIELEYKLKIEQKTAEYQALQAEVDPHFLYNILNLFITLNRIGEKGSWSRPSSGSPTCSATLASTTRALPCGKSLPLLTIISACSRSALASACLFSVIWSRGWKTSPFPSSSSSLLLKMPWYMPLSRPTWIY